MGCRAMTVERGAASGWLRALALAAVTLAVSSCRNHAGRAEGEAESGGSDHGLISALVDGEPHEGALDVGELRPGSVVEIRSGAATGLLLTVREPPGEKLRYYGLPGYPLSLGAEIGERSESEEAEGEPTVTLIATDPVSQVSEWYRKRLTGWSVLERASDELVFVQQPRGRRQVLISAIPEVGLVVIEYRIFSEDGPPPTPLGEEAGEKAEGLLRLKDALDQYLRDTGKQASSVADLMATTGPPGYGGPYIIGKAPTDPYSGRPYEVEDGVITGPGDVQHFTN